MLKNLIKKGVQVKILLILIEIIFDDNSIFKVRLFRNLIENSKIIIK